jgi:hypothetical protein
MSKLESKLSASIQTQRRASGAPKKSETARPADDQKTEKQARPAPVERSTDLNAGGGRERNPDRIWPD